MGKSQCVGTEALCQRKEAVRTTHGRRGGYGAAMRRTAEGSPVYAVVRHVGVRGYGICMVRLVLSPRCILHLHGAYGLTHERSGRLDTQETPNALAHTNGGNPGRSDETH